MVGGAFRRRREMTGRVGSVEEHPMDDAGKSDVAIETPEHAAK